jgi:hypothetical protein
LTLPKKTSPQLATTLRRISRDLEPYPGSTPQYQGPKDRSTTTCIHTRILTEVFVSVQDWCRYLLKYPDEAVTFNNVGHPAVCRLVPTLYEINTEQPQSPQPALQAAVNSQQRCHGFGDSELNAQSKVIVRHIVLPNLIMFNQSSSSGLSDLIDIDSLAHTVMHTGSVSRSPREWWVASTNTTTTPIPDFNNLVMEPDKEVLKTSLNILHDEEPKLYRQAISRADADLWHPAIEADIDALRRNHTWDVVDRCTDRKIVDSKWVFKLNCLSDESVNQFKARLVQRDVPKFCDRNMMRHLPWWYWLIPCAFAGPSSLRMGSSSSNLISKPLSCMASFKRQCTCTSRRIIGMAIKLHT